MLLIVAIIFAFIEISQSAEKPPERGVLLQDRHKFAEVCCADCHDEKLPAKKVSMDRCIDCHGDYKGLAELTRETDPNPHDHHEGPLDCSRCHHVHMASEDYCLECHSWGYRVP
jgi:cytochrome c3-like protein